LAQVRYYLRHALDFQAHGTAHPTPPAPSRIDRPRIERQLPMTDWASVRYAVVDVEDNGQQPPDHGDPS
jgi:hypothetical protein